MDLDSTLVNMFGTDKDWSYTSGEKRPEVLDRILDIKVTGNFMWGAKRPYCEHFLTTCFKLFDIVGVWSAGSTAYVEEVVVELFNVRMGLYPKFVWTKPNCVNGLVNSSDILSNPLRIKQKPLSLLFKAYPDIDPNRTLIIDDMHDVCEQDTLLHVHVPAFGGTFESLHVKDDALLRLSDWMEINLPKSKDYKSLPLKGVFEYASQDFGSQ